MSKLESSHLKGKNTRQLTRSNVFFIYLKSPSLLRDLNAIPEAQIAELAVNHPVHKVEVKDDINQAQYLKKTNNHSSFYHIFATDSTATRIASCTTFLRLVFEYILCPNL
jgi:hypothetical protein